MQWKNFYPKSQMWVKGHEGLLNKICQGFMIIICLVALFMIVIPSTLDLPYAITKKSEVVSGTIIEKSKTAIHLNNEQRYDVGNTIGIKVGDEVEINYLPFTKYATINRVN